MLTPLTINRPGSVDLGVALIWPVMRAVLACPAGVFTEEAG